MKAAKSDYKGRKKRIVVAMSGGVDSSVAALLLKKQGYEVIGLFMKCFSDTKNPLTGECSWINEKLMAEKIASILKIPIIIADFEKEYKKQVIEPMINEYSSGKTPNPDIACNTIIKFPLIWKKAQKLDADFMATGHYARIKKDKSGYQLLSGRDNKKDQSYFLSELTQEDLSHTLFPIGNINKKEVRAIAKKNNLPNWSRQGTRGICFVGKLNIKSFLEKSIKKKPGIVLDEKGNKIGVHQGISYYTIGQRVHPSIGIEINKPKEYSQIKLYIAEKRKNNALLAVPENHPLLSKKQIGIKKLHLINPKEKTPSRLEGRIRHLGEKHPGVLKKSSGGYVFIASRPIKAVAEGQYLVLYNKDKVVGSGEIML